MYNSTIDGLRHEAKIEIKNKVVHIESARRQIMHIVLLKKASTCLIGVLNSIKEILVVCTY